VNTSASVLVVEDDLKIAQVLMDYLRASGYHVVHCDDGMLALERLRHEAFDLLLLDRMLPSMDGVSMCQQLRQFSTIPVIMLTAMIEEEDKLDGLEAGADDYVCKPFSPREVMARVKAQLRRRQFSVSTEAVAPFIAVNVENMSIAIQGQTLALTPVEYRLLAEFIKHPSRVYSRQQLLNVANEDYRDSGDRTIDAHIKNLRKKLSQSSLTGSLDFSDCLQSVYGVGYRFELPVTD
jgi:two-component system response regulator BaeR